MIVAWREPRGGIYKKSRTKIVCDTQHEPTEMNLFLKQIPDGAKALEIGMGRGGFHLELLKKFHHVTSVEIDTRQAYVFYHGLTNKTRSTIVVGDSNDRDVIAEVSYYGPFNFLFIDGDHECQSVLNDWGIYSPMVRIGGIVAFHDTNAPHWLPGPRQAIGMITKNWNHLGNVWGYSWYTL